jgi:hypothetical protein
LTLPANQSMKNSRKSESRIGAKARNVNTSIRGQVLHEAGYKCSNPRCRYPLTLDVHHLHYVSEGGSDDPANLLPLCPTCHQEHHAGKIPTDSLRAWKILLLAINEAFDRRSVDMLLAVFRHECIKRITGDGVLQLAPLIASGLVNVREYYQEYNAGTGAQAFTQEYLAELTDKGRLFVQGWLNGDQRTVIPLPSEDDKGPADLTE